MAIVSSAPTQSHILLAHFRERLGLSQVQAAALAGISRRTLQRLEAEPVAPSSRAAVRLGLVYLALDELGHGGPDGRRTA